MKNKMYCLSSYMILYGQLDVKPQPVSVGVMCDSAVE